MQRPLLLTVALLAAAPLLFGLWGLRRERMGPAQLPAAGDGRAFYSMPAYNFTRLRDADVAAQIDSEVLVY
jgi:hypothetical protein